MLTTKIEYRLRHKTFNSYLLVGKKRIGKIQTYSLSALGLGETWTAKIPQHAEWVRLYGNDIKHTKSSMLKPYHPYKPDDLEVVRCDIAIEDSILNVNLLTNMELYKHELEQKNLDDDTILNEYLKSCIENNIDPNKDYCRDNFYSMLNYYNDEKIYYNDKVKTYD